MWEIASTALDSHLLVGSAGYPSLEVFEQSIKASETNVVTVSLKREKIQAGNNLFFKSVKELGCHLLPNTAGCTSAKEAIQLAFMAREIFDTPWIKLEVIADEQLLQPHPFELVDAAKVLINEGFEVFPYCTEDTVLCKKLVDCGCKVLMPWGAPIGSGQGILNPFGIKLLRQRFRDVKIIIDAGIGSPLDALEAMLLGVDGILLNTAIAKAIDPINMARAFKLAVDSGRLAFDAGRIPKVEMALASTPLEESLYWEYA